MKRAKERQITFYADPDVYDWLKSKNSVTRLINEIIRGAMTEEKTGVAAQTSARQKKGSPLDQVVSELEEIQRVIMISYDRQQAMIGALRTHQKLFEKSASFYKELGRIKDKRRPQSDVEEVVSSYNELLENSADSILHIIANSEEDLCSLAKASGLKQKLIAAVKTDEFEDRNVETPARSFQPKFSQP